MAVACNRKPEDAQGVRPDRYAEFDTPETIVAVADAIAAGGHDVVVIEADDSFVDRIREERVDIVFNMSEGVRGESREAHVPAILEMLNIPYTGSGVLSLALSLDKPMSKRVLSASNIPTPRFVSLPPGTCEAALPFPLFVKPALEGSSMGVGPQSLVRTPAELSRAVRFVHGQYEQDALVEAFLPGREFTVGIIGHPPRTLPPLEILFDACPPEHGAIYSRQFKMEFSTSEFFRCPADTTPQLDRELRTLALAAYSALGCRDCGRVDIRLDQQGRPHVIELNPLPGLTPDWSDLPRAATAGGMGYQQLVLSILHAAMVRLGLGEAALPRFT